VPVAIHLGEKETLRGELTRTLLSFPTQELASTSINAVPRPVGCGLRLVSTRQGLGLGVLTARKILFSWLHRDH
jgi:hypothetical protein